MICIATKGKFSCPPSKKASAKYGGGGGTSAGVQYVDKPHKFPQVRIREIDKEEQNINIGILEVIDESQE
jgi:hypothetical protein